MIHVSEKAAVKIRELLQKEGVPAESGGLRVGVQGGGCSGLSYAMRLDTEARNRDKVFEENGARIFVDPKSYLYLRDTTLDPAMPFRSTVPSLTKNADDAPGEREMSLSVSRSIKPPGSLVRLANAAPLPGPARALSFPICC